MTGVKISALPAANAANDTDQMEVNQDGVSRRVTVGQIVGAVGALRTLATLLELTQTTTLDGIVLTECRAVPGDQGGGAWVFQTGNQTANVTADPQAGLWAAPDSAPTGASGAWQRQFTGPASSTWWPFVGDGVADDSATLQAFFNVPYDLALADGTYRITSAVTNSTDRRNIVGSNNSSTQIICNGNGEIVFADVDFCVMSDLLITGQMLHNDGKALLRIDAGCSDCTFDRLRLINGYYLVRIAGGLRLVFNFCLFDTAIGIAEGKPRGELISGVNGTSWFGGGFYDCIFADRQGVNAADGIVSHGNMNSLVLRGNSFNFLHHGLYAPNETSAGFGFLYISDRGFENLSGSCIRLESVAQGLILMDNVYATNDEASDVIYQSNQTDGSIHISNCSISSGGRNGIYIGHGPLTMTGSFCGNNASLAYSGQALTVVTATNSAGKYLITWSGTQRWIPMTGDRVSIQGVVGGTANGVWFIDVVSPTTFTLRASTYTTDGAGGTVYLRCYSVRVGPTAARVNITGNHMGYSGSGLNRQSGSVLIENGATDCLITSNDFRGNVDTDYLNLSTSSSVKIFDNALNDGSANTLNTPQVIETTDNTKPALRITQLAADMDALLVEDATNPDNTPTLINAAGVFVSGHTAALAQFGTTPRIQLIGSLLASTTFGQTHWSASASAPATHVFSKSQSGTIGTHGAVTINADLGLIVAEGSDGSAFVQASQMIAEADIAASAGIVPGRWRWLTANSAGVMTSRMRLDSKGMFNVGEGGSLGRGAPIIKTADFTVADSDNWLTNNKAGATLTITLPAASTCTGRELMITNWQAFTVVSASANIVPLGGGTAAAAILSATAGRWCTLVAGSTNWNIVQGVV